MDAMGRKETTWLWGLSGCGMHYLLLTPLPFGSFQEKDPETREIRADFHAPSAWKALWLLACWPPALTTHRALPDGPQVLRLQRVS